MLFYIWKFVYFIYNFINSFFRREKEWQERSYLILAK